MLYDKYMSVPEKYKPYIEKEFPDRQFCSVNRGLMKKKKEKQLTEKVTYNLFLEISPHKSISLLMFLNNIFKKFLVVTSLSKN
ncbi:hypothetical protein CW304_27785 [Bacillus sp. UFRGS-B20]|nr:hypothetical protein CW304_27785 [Bacillus sp. UFRGS-B20]